MEVSYQSFATTSRHKSVAKTPKKRNSNGMGISQALRDVLVASINKGQFPLAVFALIFGLIIFKMPPEDVSKLVFEVLGMLQRWEMVGYILSFFGFGGWFVHAKWQRQMITNEMRRLSIERTKAQGSKMGSLIKSSEETL